jgi:hypothetical protein
MPEPEKESVKVPAKAVTVMTDEEVVPPEVVYAGQERPEFWVKRPAPQTPKDAE